MMRKIYNTVTYISKERVIFIFLFCCIEGCVRRSKIFKSDSASIERKVSCNEENIAAERIKWIMPNLIENNAINTTSRKKKLNTIPQGDCTNRIESFLLEAKAHDENEPLILFTIQVYTGTNRKKSEEIRTNLCEWFTNLKPIWEYKNLAYQVRLGLFNSQLDAQKTYKNIKRKFPNAIVRPITVKQKNIT